MKIKVNGIEVNYQIHGDTAGSAPWVTLSHSLACNLHMWDEQIATLAKRYRVLAYDTRGHGKSDAPVGAYTLEQLADDAKALLDALKITRTHWVGLSMGGMIGQVFALKYPDVLQTLVLCDTTSRYPKEAAAMWAERVKTATTQGMEPLVAGTLARWFTEPFRTRGGSRFDEVAAMIRSTPPLGYAGCCQAIPTIDVTDRLPTIKAPILVIVGEQDAGTPVAMAQAIQANAPGSELVIIPNAAHISNVEQPEAFERALMAFLARH
ncbi:MAG: 3-oxoadipate enol-lactonase [Proteobacteria bacterium]|nr:3-oxoadipate enol-lactonase [Burkholderiales bacterium]